ncbi:MAG: response regulator [Bdellovibrio sp.]|nr:MAG: response regulator [Bdellovibrio sp.]
MGLSVMIVDDAGFVREILAQILEDLGYQVVAEAQTGDEALAKAVEYRPELIVMDLILPEKNGAEASHEILEVLPSTLIIAMSTASETFVRDKALRSGCVAFLEKPFNKKSVQAVLQKLKFEGEANKHG